MAREHSRVGIYIHIPFCEKKCFYCDFYSIENHSLRGEFIEALVLEIKGFGKSHSRLEADTLFFGGGTPSLLTPREMERILEAVHHTFQLSHDSEFTVECNPGATDTAYLREYKVLGANRLSFGVQSFFEDELKFLSRIHSASQAEAAVHIAREAGYSNINVDLIYALPHQTEDRLSENLRRVVSLAPDHISAYNLIVEQGTPLSSAVANGSVIPAQEETEVAMYEQVMEYLEVKGYSHYEISNYARPGFECRHNLKYWNAEEYIGFGPSAHSYLEGERWWNVSSLSNYVSDMNSGRDSASAREKLTPTQKFDEYVLLNLRQGRLDPQALRRKFGVNLSDEFLSGVISQGYFSDNGDLLRMTRKGFAVCDEITETLLARHSLPQ